MARKRYVKPRVVTGMDGSDEIKGRYYSYGPDEEPPDWARAAIERWAEAVNRRDGFAPSQPPPDEPKP